MCAQCVVCGADTKVFKSSGKAKKYCGRKCYHGKRSRRRVKERTCKQCGVAFVGYGECCGKKCNQLYRYHNPKSQPKRCQQCAQAFNPKPGRKGAFCSRECAWTFKSETGAYAVGILHPWTLNKQARAVADGCLRVLLRWVSIERTHAARQIRISERLADVIVPCDRCGVEVVKRRGGKCLTKANRCKKCRASFKRAHRKRAEARRYLRKRNHPSKRCEVIVEEDVFCSSLWLCGICKEPVDHRLVAPHPLAAEMDHVVPLSKGGTHTRDNVQCTHRICNNAKSDGTQDEARRAINFIRWLTGKSVRELAT